MRMRLGTTSANRTTVILVKYGLQLVVHRITGVPVVYEVIHDPLHQLLLSRPVHQYSYAMMT